MSTTVCLYFYAEICLSEGMVSVYILLSLMNVVLNKVALNKMA